MHPSGQTVRNRPIVCTEVEQECADEISVVPYSTPYVRPKPPNGGGGGIAGSKLDIGIVAKRRRIEQNVVLRGIGKSYVGFRLAQLTTP